MYYLFNDDAIMDYEMSADSHEEMLEMAIDWFQMVGKIKEVVRMDDSRMYQLDYGYTFTITQKGE